MMHRYNMDMNEVAMRPAARHAGVIEVSVVHVSRSGDGVWRLASAVARVVVTVHTTPRLIGGGPQP